VELTYCQLTRQHNGDSWQAGPTGSAHNGEILTCRTAMGPRREMSRQYLVCPHFVQNGPSEELPTQLFNWRLLQATKVPVSLWQGTRWPQTKSPTRDREKDPGRLDFGPYLFPLFPAAHTHFLVCCRRTFFYRECFNFCELFLKGSFSYVNNYSLPLTSDRREYKIFL
jgi:hypothetical protein